MSLCVSVTHLLIHFLTTHSSIRIHIRKRTLSDQVLSRVYEQTFEEQGSQGEVPSLPHYVSTQMLRHQRLAEQIFRVARQKEEVGASDPLVIALLPLNDIRFGYGVPLRLLGQVHRGNGDGQKLSRATDPLYRPVFSLALNPTTQDSLGIRQLRLSLRMRSDLPSQEDGKKRTPPPSTPTVMAPSAASSSPLDTQAPLLAPLPPPSSSPPTTTVSPSQKALFDQYELSPKSNSNRFADFVFFSRSPPLYLLSRAKPPIDREGQKPAGEESLLGVF